MRFLGVRTRFYLFLSSAAQWLRVNSGVRLLEHLNVKVNKFDLQDFCNWHFSDPGTGGQSGSWWSSSDLGSIVDSVVSLCIPMDLGPAFQK